ncbi:hypothetical protein PEBR_04414 [Penicillium brasilianum]|uniref:Uncharacterized protein n=1 Tax=Penicillium brasilianum TaxID=104259 RepID=A0A1S9RZ01_PENBI|nr:hypothetical protein PEBR_04414 [Penicillium brasilianum]
MSPSTPKYSWTVLGALALLSVSTVYAQPIRESTTQDQAQPLPAVLPRDPRLIPDTEHYLSEVFDLLGVSLPTTTTSIPTETPTETTVETPSSTGVHGPFVKAEHGVPTNLDATPVISSDGVMYSSTVKHESGEPIANIDIGPGWHGGKKLSASDLPFIFAAVETELASQWRNVIDSADELGLHETFPL